MNALANVKLPLPEAKLEVRPLPAAKVVALIAPLMSRFGPATDVPTPINVTPFTTTLLVLLWPNAAATVYVNVVEIPLSASLVHAVVLQPRETPAAAQNVPAIAIAAHEGVATEVLVQVEPVWHGEHDVYPACAYLPAEQGTTEDEVGHALPGGQGAMLLDPAGQKLPTTEHTLGAADPKGQ